MLSVISKVSVEMIATLYYFLVMVLYILAFQISNVGALGPC